ncbi:hypothetical protein CDAR_231301 [Caerostris darwini]|uniref:Uncharacterized protein n=1 Tax=Caerostris darwini TaxID=1538125 RepID=A0AAV4WPK2_9ARAC|nr:hypothetical protein CDAR_231301 [Caerostris darwini]
MKQACSTIPSSNSQNGSLHLKQKCADPSTLRSFFLAIRGRRVSRGLLHLCQRPLSSNVALTTNGETETSCIVVSGIESLLSVAIVCYRKESLVYSRSKSISRFPHLFRRHVVYASPLFLRCGFPDSGKEINCSPTEERLIRQRREGGDDRVGFCVLYERLLWGHHVDLGFCWIKVVVYK